MSRGKFKKRKVIAKRQSKRVKYPLPKKQQFELSLQEKYVAGKRSQGQIQQKRRMHCILLFITEKKSGKKSI
jgi:hypothetical protein